MYDKTIISLNNTFNEDTLHDAIVDIQTSSYPYLYNLQKNLLNYSRFDTSGKQILATDRRNEEFGLFANSYYFTIEYSIISESKKYKFRKSRLYNSRISFNDIISEPDLIDKIPLIFIDGELETSIDFYFTDNHIYCIFDIDYIGHDGNFSKEYIESLISENVNISTLLITNADNRIFKSTNKYILEKNDINIDSLESIGLALPVNESLIILNDKYNNYITDTVTSNNKISIRNRIINNSLSGKVLDMYSIGIGNFLDKVTLLPNERFFEIPLQDMPVTSENCLIFRKNGSELIFDHESSIKAYYPNIYELINNDDSKTYVIYMFYHKGNSITVDFKNKLSLLNRVNYSILDGYKNDNLLISVKDFIDIDIDYNIKNFINSGDDILDYKINKLKNLIYLDSNNLNSYLSENFEKRKSIILEEPLSKLEVRKRINCNDINIDVSFDKPRYLYTIRKSVLSDISLLRVFIDGLLYMNYTIFDDNLHYFIYIDCDIISESSVVEFLILTSKSYMESITFKNIDDIKTIVIEDSFFIQDLMIVDSEYNLPISTDNYIVYIEDIDGNFIPTTKEFNSIISNNIKIKLTESKFSNRVLYLKIVRKPNYIIQEIKSNDDIGKAMYFHHDIDRDKEHFRIYKNGKMVSTRYYDIKYRDTLDKSIGVDVLFKKEIGDVFVLDYQPDFISDVCFIDELPENGFIDLSGKIDMPISTKWFEIYVNGTKLYDKNIDVISPTKCILRDITSLEHLYIIKYNRDSEYFSLDTSLPNINDRIWNESEEIRNKIMDNNLIVDNEDSLFTEEVFPISIDYDRFYEFTINKNKGVINPDTDEIDIIDKIYYPELFSNKVHLLNPDISENAPSILEIGLREER